MHILDRTADFSRLRVTHMDMNERHGMYYRGGKTCREVLVRIVRQVASFAPLFPEQPLEFPLLIQHVLLTAVVFAEYLRTNENSVNF